MIARNNPVGAPNSQSKWDAVKKHNSRPVTMRTYEGTVSQSWNNNEDRNAPIAANQGVANSDT